MELERFNAEFNFIDQDIRGELIKRMREAYRTYQTTGNPRPLLGEWELLIDDLILTEHFEVYKIEEYNARLAELESYLYNGGVPEELKAEFRGKIKKFKQEFYWDISKEHLLSRPSETDEFDEDKSEV